MSKKSGQLKGLIADEDLPYFEKVMDQFMPDAALIHQIQEDIGKQQPLSEKDKAQLKALRDICLSLRVGGYEGPVEIVWDNDGKARLQIDPQAGRSKDEPPVC